MLSESEEILVNIPDISKDKKAIDLIGEYIRRGNIISSHSSPPLQSIELQVGKDTAGQFVSIVVPSLSGKTQTAFNIRSKRPLYFSFDTKDGLYKNFATVSEKLMEFAQSDRLRIKEFVTENKLIKRTADPRNPKGSSYDYIAIDELRHVSEMKLKTLGYFQAFMQEGETKFDGSNWMKHYFRPRSLSFKPVSISDFLNNPNHRTFIKRYFIFLDEYHGHFDLLFVRNLCRYVHLTCLMTTSYNYADINIMSPEESEKYARIC